MTFRHLEEAFTEGKDRDLKRYLEVFPELHDPTKTVLGYALDIASYLKASGLEPQYCLFGGYGVLSHLMASFGEDAARFWRGSTDIDMFGTTRVLNELVRGYCVKSNMASQNLPNKRTLRLIEDTESECKIDFVINDDSNRLIKPAYNRHFGIRLGVLPPIGLIRSKLHTPESEPAHAIDILGLLAVLEKRGTSPKEIVRGLEPQYRGDLLKRVRFGTALVSKDRFGIAPTISFKSKLERELVRAKPVRQ